MSKPNETVDLMQKLQESVTAATARVAFEHVDSHGAVLGGLYYPGPDEGCPQCGGSGCIDDETAYDSEYCIDWIACPTCNRR